MEVPDRDGVRATGILSLAEMDKAFQWLFREHCPPCDKAKFKIFPASSLARSMRENIRLDEDVLRADWMLFPIPAVTNDG